MPNARLRPLLALSSLAFSVGLGLGCSLILDPANSDDVVRCTNSTDCEADDNFSLILNADYRLAAQCANTGAGGGDIGQSSGQQVCAAIYDQEIGCNGANFDMSLPMGMAYAAAAAADVYKACDGAYVGTTGCRPCTENEADNVNFPDTALAQCIALGGPGCVDGGTQVDRAGVKICVPAEGGDDIYPANGEVDGESLEFQDVFDQHCRSFFCDDTFVCDRTTFKCVPCDDELPFASGGCGDLYIGGARSTVYLSQDQLDGACDPGKAKDSAGAQTEFGPTPTL
ncbi:MAG: hypothetical protein KC468_27410 [Myxococcales bacterium]|nr:hypothetical protein [Myxococcales bacterium]